MWPAKNIMLSMWPAVLCRFPTAALATAPTDRLLFFACRYFACFLSYTFTCAESLLQTHGHPYNFECNDALGNDTDINRRVLANDIPRCVEGGFWRVIKLVLRINGDRSDVARLPNIFGSEKTVQ